MAGVYHDTMHRSAKPLVGPSDLCCLSLFCQSWHTSVIILPAQSELPFLDFKVIDFFSSSEEAAALEKVPPVVNQAEQPEKFHQHQWWDHGTDW
jgi:hypothetical protein